MKEDLNYLSEWFESILSDIKKINEKKSASEILVFMIGNTANSDTHFLPYRTPLRKIVGGYVLGSVVFTQTQAIILSLMIDGQVDYICLDAEKKIKTISDPDLTPFDHFEFSDHKPIKSIEYGNISRACINVISKTPTYEYKANDATVDATWYFLIEKYSDLSGKNIVIVGAGNIGCKLALKLVECGSSVKLLTNNIHRTKLIIQGLNSIKHQNVLSDIEVSVNYEESSINADAIVGCTNSSKVITAKMVKNMNKNGVVIDLGKGTVFENAINECIQRDIDTWRVDISALVNSIVSSSISMSQLVKTNCGRKSLKDGIGLISGGFIGKRYDVIVDSYYDPSTIIGVVDKPGKIMIRLDTRAKKSIKSAEEFIRLNK